MIEIKLSEYAPIKDSICKTSSDHDQVYEIKFHGNPVNKFPLKNSNKEKTNRRPGPRSVIQDARCRSHGRPLKKRIPHPQGPIRTG